MARYVDSSQLECASPVSSGASAKSIEVSLNGQQFTSFGVAYTYTGAVAVSSVWPVQGSAEGGTPLTVHGSGFTSASESLGYLQCRLNGTVVRAELLAGGDSLVCASVASWAGYVSVEVSTNGADFTSDGLQYESVWSVVSGVAPWSGPVTGGTLVTLTGTGLLAGAGARCRFGASTAPVPASVHSASEVRCVSPPHGSTGWASVELLSFDESVGGGGFFYEERVWVSLVLPLLGPVEGGTQLTVLGSHSVSYTHLTLPTT